MIWEGSIIKKKSDERGLSITKLAQQIGVSRQAVNDWIKGQVPKGLYLITLCDILNLDPDDLFIKGEDVAIQMPVYRTRRKAKIKPEHEVQLAELAKEYKNLFRDKSASTIHPTLKISNRSPETAKTIANKLRKAVEISSDKPMDYKEVFRLLENLDIHVIFRDFPVSRLYAFYTRIFEHRVVFVDLKTNVLDLIFPLLHESVHAIRNESKKLFVDDEEEEFCDIVASYTQFPETYIKQIYEMIVDLDPPNQINILKQFSQTNHHAICGIIKRIKDNHSEFDLSYGGADTNLKKNFPKIGEVLSKTDNVRQFLQNYQNLSPIFFDILLDKVENLNQRKLGEIFSMESYLDMVSIRDEMLQMKKLRSK